MEDKNKKLWTRWPKMPKGREASDPTLVIFATRIPRSILVRFNDAIRWNGEKIQTVIKRFMEKYIEDTEHDIKQ